MLLNLNSHRSPVASLLSSITNSSASALVSCSEKTLVRTVKHVETGLWGLCGCLKPPGPEGFEGLWLGQEATVTVS